MTTNLENDFNFQEQLRRYAAGELPASDQAVLLQTIQQSDEAAREARFSLGLAGALQHREHLQVGALVGDIIAEEGLPPHDPSSGQSGRSKIKGGKGLLGMAAVVLIGLGIYGAVAGGLFAERLPAQWSRDYLQPLENVLFTADETNTRWELRVGMEAYNAQNYEEAVANLNVYYIATKDPNAGLYLGIAQLMAGQQEAAISVLTAVSEAQQGPALDAAQWYLSLALLENNEIKKARTLLQSIPENSLYFQQAQELLLLLK